MATPLLFNTSYFGPDVIKIPSTPFCLSINAKPFSAPRTLTAVASASADVALPAIRVTLDKPSLE